MPTSHHLPIPFIAVTMLVVIPLHAMGEGFSMEDIVVTGTRTERKLLDVPVRTEVVSKEEIRKVHARDIAEALRNQPGILLKDIHGKSGTEIWLQGMDSNRVLVLINGRPISASTGSTVDLTQLAAGDIDRVEIVKGAVSALYGSSAMGGVVNIITRRSKDPFSYTFVADAGSFGDKNIGNQSDLSARHLLLDLTANKDKWSGRLGGDLRQTDGFDLDKSTFRFEGDKGDKFNLNAKLNYHPSSATKISFASSLYTEDLSKNFSSFAPGVGVIKKRKNEETTRITSTLAFTHSLKADGKLSGYLMHESFDNKTQQDVLVTDPIDQRRKADLGFYKTDLQWDQPIGEKQLWTVGATGFKADLTQHQKRLEGADIVAIDEISPGADRSSVEFYAQNNIFLTEQWELLPGFRFQEDSDFGDHIAPKLNLMMSPDWWPSLETRVRIGIGEGYRVPNLKERYFIFDHSALGYMVLGNPNLTPETSRNLQFGIEISQGNHFQAEISLFHNEIENLIDTDRDTVLSAETRLNIFRYANIDKARTKGGDIGARYHFSPEISANLGYSYLDAINRETGKRLTRRPEHQVTLGADWYLSRWKTDLSLRSTYQTEEFVDGDNTLISPRWNTLDLKFNHRLREGITLFAGIDNITDEHRNPLLGGQDFRPEKGRFIYLGMRLEGKTKAAPITKRPL